MHSPVVAELAAVAVSILSAEASVAVAEERIPSAVGVAAALQAVEEVPVAAAVASSCGGGTAFMGGGGGG